MLAKSTRGELGKNSFADPAFIGVVETVSLCLLSYRTAAHLSRSSPSVIPENA